MNVTSYTRRTDRGRTLRSMKLPVGGAKREYSLSTVGVDDAGGPPVPIPNTEVKPGGAEDSWLATACENREMPTSDSEYSSFLSIHNFSQSFQL